ncbi:hypothetical protein [Aliagarivorans taiwanensis]|uniref:hypothetical protein n=1 Tax=Aliagarivorans taiwanensis TaxID=561966 RepID=UPI00047C7009|nr:hypothetical protein [Aliagarivorans taiwanensis]
MTASGKIEGTAEAWEDGRLGQDEQFATIAKVTLDDLNIEASLTLKPISIRLEEELIEHLKLIADIHGQSYQPLIRQVLHRFAKSEIKRLLKEMVREQGE